MKKPQTVFKYKIVLIRNGYYLPQNGLGFDDRKKAQETANYLNSLLPDNLRGYESYFVAHWDEY